MFGHNLPTANASWPSKGSNDANFRLDIILNEKTDKLPLESFSHWLVTSWGPPLGVRQPQKIFQTQIARFCITTRRLSASSEDSFSSIGWRVMIEHIRTT